MKRLLLVLLVVGVLAAFAAMSSKAPARPTELKAADCMFDRMTLDSPEVFGVGVPDFAPAPPDPVSLAQLPAVESMAPTFADTMESPPTRYETISAEASEIQISPACPESRLRDERPHNLGKESAVLYSDRVSVRDHAPC